MLAAFPGTGPDNQHRWVQRLLWLPRVVVACAYVGAATNPDPKPANLPCQLLLYPRYHLDHSSLLARYPLPQVSLCWLAAAHCVFGAVWSLCL